MKKYIILFLFILGVVFTSCEYDNYDEPKATLRGQVVYDGTPVSVRTNGPQFELFQDGYDKEGSIPVYVAYDGTYSASVFSGEYKLVRKAGAPWEDQNKDTLLVKVSGTTEYDVPVIPYFVIRDESFKVENNSIKATFTIDQISNKTEIDAVRFYVGRSILTDQQKNEYRVSGNMSEIKIGEEATMVADIANFPEILQKSDYVYVRVAVRSKATSEYFYTQPQKVELK